MTSILKQQAGFTLAETLIAVILLAIVLAGGMSFYFNSGEVMGLVTHKKTALELANARMEEVKGGGYSALPDPASTPVVIENIDITIGDLPAKVADGLGQKVTVVDVDDPPGGATATDYKQITVELLWKEAGKGSARQIQLVTYMAP